ncbi:DMT family transporter [Olsenella massiliensis]|uniref:multidrug ABC transporter n=1 Tax=Olsenella massiliensis TaxID=1622075 RepID=UPI00071C9469|nr:multidrug ABC transporter [Olsenella massiliensis]
MSGVAPYAALALLGVFVSGVSQVLLKKSAIRGHASRSREYLNPLVITAYALFVLATLLSTLAYKVIPLSMGPILDATGYLYVTGFGVTIFKERLDRRQALALCLIIGGIVIYALGV